MTEFWHPTGFAAAAADLLEPDRIDWDVVNDIAVAATEELLATAGLARLDGVRVIGLDEHRWAHVRSAPASLPPTMFSQ